MMHMRLTHELFLFLSLLCELESLTNRVSLRSLYPLDGHRKNLNRWNSDKPDATTTKCRSADQDKYCSPPFQNIATIQKIQSTSVCGASKVQRLCMNDGTCQVCDARSDISRFSIHYLSDTHKITNQTCWASSYIRPDGVEKTVNLTLSLGKRFELEYINLLPCSIGALPDSIAIHKSSDFGLTWRPWHYFSTDCYRAFGLPTTNENAIQISKANLQEVLCFSLLFTRAEQWNRHRRSMPTQQKKTIISFNTLLGRPSVKPWGPALVDWMTMTDMRISLMRFPRYTFTDYRRKRTVTGKILNPHMPLYDAHGYRRYINKIQYPFKGWDYGRFRRHALRGKRDEYSDLNLPTLDLNNTSIDPITSSTPDSKVNPDEADVLNNIEEPNILAEGEFYALADVEIGGHCKCNGHADQCVIGINGRLTCDCKHHTDGDDCERCQPGYMDRPWERATEDDAKSCIACDCNLHSSECRFANELYLVSNRQSGGVCENCQHNTAGRNCQYCAEGFYRDWTKPISHEHVCIACRCHPIGSIIRQDCDRRTGQCRCKQGVTGLTCDRCQEGYQQTRSPTNPCTKAYAPHTVAMAHTPVDIRCTTCATKKERIRLKKFCRKDMVIQATFKSRELHGSMARFEMKVVQGWQINELYTKNPAFVYWPVKNDYIALTGQQLIDFRSRSSLNHDEELVPIWVKLNDLRCKCPDIELGITYLIVSDMETQEHGGRKELLFTTNTAVLPWRPTWERRLARFRRRKTRGACEKFKDESKLHGTKQTNIHRDSVHSTWYPSQQQDAMHLNSYSQPIMRTAYRRPYPIYNRHWRPYLYS